MEDSGFDSEDRLNFMNFRNNESENSSNDDNGKNNNKTENPIDFDEVLYRNPSLLKSDDLANSNKKSVPSSHLNEHNKKISHINTCKGLQRKLELKVEKAKKHFHTAQANPNDRFQDLEALDDLNSKKSSDNLIPINRLQFPRNENQPLIAVEFRSDSDEEDTSFFPINKKHRRLRTKRTKRKDVEVDTFSIQEMTIIESDESDGNEGDESGSEGDCDSQLNLELLTPKTGASVLEKFRKLICCTKSAQNVF